MATTIQSGRSNSPLLTADVASRAEIFGGRALNFDGASDYLTGTIGEQYSSLENFSVSVWTTVDTASDWRRVFTLDNAEVRFGIKSTGKMTFYPNGSTGDIEFDQSALSTTGGWYHHVITFEKSTTTVKHYLNGALDYTKTNCADAVLDASGTYVVGSYTGTSLFWHGKISDLKLFDATLTEAQAQELYLKPEQSAPSAVKDNIFLWLPMSESNPESPQSIVYDHSEKKLDSNILANGTFDTNISGWVNSSHDTTSSTNFRTITHATIDGRTCIDINDQSEGGGASRMSANYDIGGNLFKANTLYKISYYARKSETDSTNKHYIVALGHEHVGITSGSVFKSVSEYDTWEYHELYIISSTSNYKVHFCNTSSGSGIHNEHKGRLFLDDIKVQKVLMGNHATTNFFGNELITNGGFEANSNWTTSGAINSARVSSPKPVHSGTYSWTFEANSQYDGIYGDTYTTITGNTYAYDLWVYPNDGTDIQVKRRDGANSADATLSTTALTQGQWNNITGTYVETSGGSGAYLAINSNNATSGVWYVDDVSVKEVGVSSTGFATAQNEPVIPQIPLVKYNEKMLFDGVSNEVEVTNPFNFGASTDFSISFWLLATDVTQQDKFILRKKSGSEGMRIFFTANDSMLFNMYDGSNEVNPTSANNSLTDNTLHHCCISVDRNGNAQWYINGIASGSAVNVSAVGNINNTTNLFIGSQNGTAYFDGLLDDLAVFNVALSSTEVQELFNDGVALDATTHSKFIDTTDLLGGSYDFTNATQWNQISDANRTSVTSITATSDNGSIRTTTGSFENDSRLYKISIQGSVTTGNITLKSWGGQETWKTGITGTFNETVYATTSYGGLMILLTANTAVATITSLKIERQYCAGYWRNDGVTTWTDRSGVGNTGNVAGKSRFYNHSRGIKL